MSTPELPFKLIHRGKVRDVFEIDNETLLMIATDRLSAFDVVLPDRIPNKGVMLTQISNHWFKKTSSIIKNHIIEWDGAHLVTNDEQKSWLKGRSVVVQKLKPLPVEAIVRGYIIGSGWKDYLNSGAICGIELPEGLQQAEQLKNPLFTPSSKADVGDHDINISFDKMIKLIGSELAHQVRDVSLGIYQFAVELAEKAGIIIADTKFEFGLDKDNQLVLMDEVLTPDSSRFWPQESYRIGTSPASYDKQFVRDYLETLDWNKTTPGPKIPQEIIEQTAKLYEQAYTRLSKLG